MRDHAHYTLYNCAYLIFMVSRLSVKIESFPLYGSHNTSMHTAARVRSHDTTALILYYGWGVRVYLAATPMLQSLPSMAISDNIIIIVITL